MITAGCSITPQAAYAYVLSGPEELPRTAICYVPRSEEGHHMTTREDLIISV
jgi:hypothetical protein